MTLSKGEEVILQRMLEDFGDYLERSDYSFFKGLTMIQCGVMLKALAQVKLYPFSLLTEVRKNGENLYTFYMNIPYLLRDENDFITASSWITEVEKLHKLCRIARELGLNIYLYIPDGDAAHLIVSKGDKATLIKNMEKRFEKKITPQQITEYVETEL